MPPTIGNPLVDYSALVEVKPDPLDWRVSPPWSLATRSESVPENLDGRANQPSTRAEPGTESLSSSDYPQLKPQWLKRLSVTCDSGTSERQVVEGGDLPASNINICIQADENSASSRMGCDSKMDNKTGARAQSFQSPLFWPDSLLVLSTARTYYRRSYERFKGAGVLSDVQMQKSIEGCVSKVGVAFDLYPQHGTLLVAAMHECYSSTPSAKELLHCLLFSADSPPRIDSIAIDGLQAHANAFLKMHLEHLANCTLQHGF